MLLHSSSSCSRLVSDSIALTFCTPVCHILRIPVRPLSSSNFVSFTTFSYRGSTPPPSQTLSISLLSSSQSSVPSTRLAMPPTIHCIRHGQGFHNLYADYTLPDPRLTPLGEEQCATLQSEHFPPDKRNSISLVAASPLVRTLHTAWLVFQPLLSQSSSLHSKPEAGREQLRTLALPDAQETSSDPCDVGTDLPTLSAFLNFQDPPWPSTSPFLQMTGTRNHSTVATPHIAMPSKPVHAPHVFSCERE